MIENWHRCLAAEVGKRFQRELLLSVLALATPELFRWPQHLRQRSASLADSRGAPGELGRHHQRLHLKRRASMRESGANTAAALFFNKHWRIEDICSPTKTVDYSVFLDA